MPVFICDLCDAIDNTGVGWYWERNDDYLADKTLKGKALCTCCAPSEYKDGKPTEYTGEWHGRFEKTIATEEYIKEIGFPYFIYMGKFEYLRTQNKDKSHQKI